MTTFSDEVGRIIRSDELIVPEFPIDAGNGSHDHDVRTDILGGTIARAPFGADFIYGFLAYNKNDGELAPLEVNKHVWTRKKVGMGAASTFAKGDKLTLVANPTATENDWWWEKAGTTDTVYGYAMKAAGNNDEFAEVWGPFAPIYPLEVLP